MSAVSLYADWVNKICAESNIRSNGELTPIKDDRLFRISSDIGDLYLKRMTSFINDELTFTSKLMEAGIIDLPAWIGHNHEMNLCMMRDMGGCDLSELTSLDMATSIKMFISLSCMQKGSIQFVKSKDFCGFDYSIGTMIKELGDLPVSAYEMLSDTQYKITRDETEKLKRNTAYVKSVLESINNTLPDTIHHGDLGMYNVRVIGEKCIFYDWGCGGVSHPFFDTFRLLSTIQRKLPTDTQATEIILDAYLQEWSNYGDYDELITIFASVDRLAGFYMMYCKFIRAWNLHRSYITKPDLLSADGLGLDIRYATAATYLKRFIETD